MIGKKYKTIALVLMIVMGAWVASPMPRARWPAERPIAEMRSQLPDVRASS